MAERKLSLKILTPDATLFSGEVKKVIVPATDGELGVLPRHAPLVSLLGMGELRATADGKVSRYAVFGGYVRVAKDEVIVLAEVAEPKEKIDEAKARGALERVMEIPPGKRSEDDRAEMARSRVRLSVKGKES
jgi:F-type H+-transporting ATPase subunit epsilon